MRVSVCEAMQSLFHTTTEPKPISRAHPCWLSDSSNTVISPCQSSSVHLFMLIIKKQIETASNFWSKIDNDCKELRVMSCQLLQLWSQGPTYQDLWIAIFILPLLSPFSLNCSFLDLHNPQVSLLHHHHKYRFMKKRHIWLQNQRVQISNIMSITSETRILWITAVDNEMLLL